MIKVSIERVFSRAELENRDARAWHLMLKALGSDMRPDEVGLRPHEKGGRRARLLAELGIEPEQAGQRPDGENDPE